MALSEHVAEDYVATGLSLKDHPVRFFREELTQLGAIRNAEHRSEAPHNAQVTVAGIVLMRQMPGTANGVVFMTLHFPDDVATNLLTISASDPKSGIRRQPTARSRALHASMAARWRSYRMISPCWVRHRPSPT